ncbi:GNAT family N-acetyltransferase [Williamsia soli]|uniref:GNAT family N-acetyltransferase n=1 Tax=Williamsia soli TaxID=364929 RepID=UPI0027DEA2BE|nr:GNAT family N-acyltransferase [Williamsia soli]
MSITPLIPAASDNGYSISLTTDPVDIEHAERLRYQLFADEMGATLPNAVRGEHTGEMIDIDQFDAHCDHMVARSESTGEVVGCFRLLPPHGAKAAGGYFTDTIFELSEGLEAARPNLFELGRAAVHSEHRSGAVMGLLWAGVLKYQELNGYEYAIGCASVRMEDGGPRGSLVRKVRDFAYGMNLSDPELRVTPKNPVNVDGRGLDDIADPGRVKIPPMVQGCMRIGAAVCGPPSYDSDFDMADFVILITRSRLNHRYLQRMTEAALAH